MTPLQLGVGEEGGVAHEGGVGGRVEEQGKLVWCNHAGGMPCYLITWLWEEARSWVLCHAHWT
jgi:hypothetical protein